MLKVISQPGPSLAVVKAYNALAVQYMRTDLALAKTYQLQGIKEALLVGDDTYLSSGYSLAISIMHNLGKTDSANYYFTLLGNLAAKTKNKENAAIQGNYYASGGLYYKRAGELKKAIPFLHKAIELSTHTGKKENLAGQLINLGNTYFLLGDYKNAITSQMQSLKIFEEENNLKGQAFCYQNIGNAFAEMKQYNKALQYVQKSYDLKKKLDDKRGMVTVESSIGDIYSGLNNPPKAIRHYKNALSIARQLNLAPDLAKIYFSLAKSELSVKDTSNAVFHFNESKRIATTIADSTSVAAVDLALLAMTKRTKSSAETEGKIAFQIAQMQKSGQLNKEVDGYKRLATYYAANGNYEQALAFSNRYHELSDSLHSNELQTQLKKIEEQYNLDKKEKEITLLKKDALLQEALIEKQQLFQTGSIIIIVLIVLFSFFMLRRYQIIQKNKQLLEIERVRNGIASDLHDDIGSTLSSINILSKIMLQENQVSNTGAKQNLVKIKENSGAIMESISDIVWAINPRNDTFDKLIYKMKEFAAELLDPLGVSYTFNTEGSFSNINLTLEKRKDLYLVFKESINNAAKHSNCSSIQILLANNRSAIILQINDDGVGFNETAIHAGNGLANIRHRAKTMGAGINLSSSPGAGTSVQLSIPSHQ